MFYILALAYVCMCAQLLWHAKSCPALCNSIDCSPPGSFAHGISQARILEWVAISFSRGSSWPRNRTQVSCIAGRFFTNWATREAPLKKVQSPFPGLGPIYLSNLISFHCHLSLSTLGKPDSSWESRSHEVQSLLEDISDACWSSGSCQVEMHCGT